MSGWIVRATGNSDDPGVIKGLLDELRSVLSKPEHGTGSSEFSSAHAAASNFHIAAEPASTPEPLPSSGPGEAATGASAEGGPFPPR